MQSTAGAQTNIIIAEREKEARYHRCLYVFKYRDPACDVIVRVPFCMVKVVLKSMEFCRQVFAVVVPSALYYIR